MNNSKFYPQWTCGLRLMEILKRIVDQHLVMDLKLGNFLIQYVFYKDYTRSKEIFFPPAFLYSEHFSLFSSYGKSFLLHQFILFATIV